MLPRVFVAAVAAALLIAAPAAAITYAPVGQPGPALSPPTADLEHSLRCTDDVAGAVREPVLLLGATGVDTTQNYSWNYEKAFTGLGIPYCTSDEPGADASNMGDIQTRGEYVVYAIRRMHAIAGRPIAVMGHSQGGMVMRWALRFWPDTRPMVADVIGMAGSNHGTNVTATCAVMCAPGVWQQGASSNFIAALNSGQETFAGIDYTEIYTHNDEIVTPNSNSSGSSSLHGPGRITNVAVQDICPLDTSEHLALGTYDPVAYALVIDALTHDGPAGPSRISSSVCSQVLAPEVDPTTFATNDAASAAALEEAFTTYPQTTAEPPLACYVTLSCPADRYTDPYGDPVGGAGSSPAPVSAHVCASRRSLTLHLDGRGEPRLRGITVTVNARRVHVTGTLGHRTVALDLRGEKGTVVVVVRGRAAGGRHKTITHRYHLCTSTSSSKKAGV